MRSFLIPLASHFLTARSATDMRQQQSLQSCFSAKQHNGENCKSLAPQELKSLAAVQIERVGIAPYNIGPVTGVDGKGWIRI